MSDSLEFRQALGQFATGVAIVTTTDAHGEPIGMTINSFASVSLEPMLVLWSIDKGAAGYQQYLDANHCVIQVLPESAQELSNLFAQKGADKFCNTSYRMIDGIPRLDSYCAQFVCTNFKQVDAGDHTVLICEVTEFDIRDESPLLFHNGQYKQF